MPGEAVTSRSIDEAITQVPTDALNFPAEFLNKMTPCGFPPHELNLKVGAVVMLLRNLDLKNGLCNGTRLRVEAIRNRVLRCRIATGSRQDQLVLIPKIDLFIENKFPFKFRRWQFPVRLSFAMTINKAQGQSFDRIGLWFNEPNFSHGQFYPSLKAFKKRDRTKREADFTGITRREISNAGTRKENQRRIFIDPKKIHKPFWEAHNTNLTPKLKKHEIDHSKETIFAEDKNDKKLYWERVKHKPNAKSKDIQRLNHHTPTYASEITPKALTYSSNNKSDKSSSKYTENDLKQDTDRVEEKINYMKRMLRMNDSDLSTETTRRPRKIESDKAANRIAKMFLALSALNHGKHRSKLKSEESKTWESEEEESDDSPIKSFNEERYKIKKWIEHMKSKRSSKTCTCTDEENEENDLFPLEKTLAKENSDDSLEECKRKIAGTKNYSLRKKLEKTENQKYRNSYSDDDLDNKIKALTIRGRRKLELPLDDLEIYRSRAKQILQNAEEILDKLNKQEEEKKLSNPVFLMNNLKELTSRIHADPRSSENYLMKMIQKNIDWSPFFRFRDEDEKKDFSKSIKSYFVDPYEKARALTEDSAKKLSAYILKNLAMLGNDDKNKEEEKYETTTKNEGMPQIHHTQDVLPAGELKSTKCDDDCEIGKEKALLPTIPTPTITTTSQYELDKKNFRDSKEIVGLGIGPFQRNSPKILLSQHILPKKVTENANKLKEDETLTSAENSEELAKDWKKSNLKDDKSEILKEDDLRAPEKYEKSEADINYAYKDLLKNQEVVLEKISENPLLWGLSDSNKKLFRFLQELPTGKNIMPEKNDELTSESFTETEPNVTTLEEKLILNHTKLLTKPKTELEDEKKSTITEKDPELAQMTQEMNLNDVELLAKDEKTENTEISYENKDNLANVHDKTYMLEKKHEINSENEEEMIESNNPYPVKEKELGEKNEEGTSKIIKEDGLLKMDQEKAFLGDQNVTENPEILDDETSQTNPSKTNKEPLESIKERSSSEIQMLQQKHSLSDEPKSENLLRIMEDEIEKKENLESLDDFKVNNELGAKNDKTNFGEIEEVFENSNSENTVDTVTIQNIPNNVGFSSEKQISQTSEENLQSIYTSKDEQELMKKEDMYPETISGELNTKQQNDSEFQEEDVQSSNLKKEEARDSVNDSKEKDISAINSEEIGNKSLEETQNNRKVIKLPGTFYENVKAGLEETKIDSDSVVKQEDDSFYKGNNSAEYLTSQNLQKAQIGLKKSDSTQLNFSQDKKEEDEEEEEVEEKEVEVGSIETKEELLESQEKKTKSTKSKEEILGSQEKNTRNTELKEELLSSEETKSAEPKESLGSQGETKDTEPQEELLVLSSQEKIARNTESKEELLALQEKETKSTNPIKEILGSQEEEIEEEGLSTKPKEELLALQEETKSTEPVKEILDSEEENIENTKLKKELLGPKEKETKSTELREEVEDATTNNVEPKDALKETNMFQDFEPENFENKEIVEKEKDWSTENGFRSVSFEDKDISQEGKDWPIKINQPEEENILQSENQKKNANNNESEERGQTGHGNEGEDTTLTTTLEDEMPKEESKIVGLPKLEKQLQKLDDNEDEDISQEKKDWTIASLHSKEENIQSENQKKDANNNENRKQMDNESEREDTPFTEKFEEEMSDKEKFVELAKSEEESEERTLEKNSDEEEVLKEKQNEEVKEKEETTDSQSSNLKESNVNITAVTKIDYDDKEKLLKKINEEEKDIMTERIDLIKHITENEDKEWATHPFEDKTPNDFKGALTGEDGLLEYYDKEEPQTSQFLEKALEFVGSTENDGLQQFNRTPKPKNLKIPQEIEKIMKDLDDGKENDTQSIQNLDPQKIDRFIDKIDKAKEENEDDDDCKKECACADRIELRSRKTGRYEIAKDFLRWLKDMKLNRVLSDD